MATYKSMGLGQGKISSSQAAVLHERWDVTAHNDLNRCFVHWAAFGASWAIYPTPGLVHPGGWSNLLFVDGHVGGFRADAPRDASGNPIGGEIYFNYSTTSKRVKSPYPWDI